MNRTKQQAALFLLGALLVGAVLGFSADRVLARAHKEKGWRAEMYQDLSLDVKQRASIDSLLDRQQCDMRRLMKPIRPQLDSLRQSGRRQILDLLTPAQRERFQARVKAEQEKAPARRNPHCDS